MSRIGKLPINIPSGVTITIDKTLVTVKGSKGELSQEILPGISVVQNDDNIIVTRESDEPIYRSRHGLMRSLIQNLVTGVTQGFSKQLEVNGVGFRVSLAGSDLKLKLGFSHEITYTIPEGIVASVDQNKITVSGIDKQRVGQIAAEIRELKKPEPYKGKGIKYIDEHIIRKSGKSGKDK